MPVKLLSSKEWVAVQDALGVAIRTCHAVQGVQTAERTKRVKTWEKLLGEVRLSEILEVVSEEYHVTKDDILGSLRDGPTSLARHVAMYLLWTQNKSIKQTSRTFRRTYGTVEYAIRQIKNRLEVDRDFKLPEL